MQIKYIVSKIISVLKSMPGYVCIMIGTGKLLGKIQFSWWRYSRLCKSCLFTNVIEATENKKNTEYAEYQHFFLQPDTEMRA